MGQLAALVLKFSTLILTPTRCLLAHPNCTLPVCGGGGVLGGSGTEPSAPLVSSYVDGFLTAASLTWVLQSFLMAERVPERCRLAEQGVRSVTEGHCWLRHGCPSPAIRVACCISPGRRDVKETEARPAPHGGLCVHHGGQGLAAHVEAAIPFWFEQLSRAGARNPKLQNP